MSAAHEEARIARPRGRLEERTEEGRRICQKLSEDRARLELVACKESEGLRRIEVNESLARQQLARLEAKLSEMPVPGDSACRELAVAERVLTERCKLALTAARIAPPPYITKELGERPTDPGKREAWERGVAEVETYRQQYGVKDPNRALGRERERAHERQLQRETLRRIRETQRVLGLGQHASRQRDLGRSLGIGR